MNTEQPSRARRVLALVLPGFALIALMLIGRRSTTAAPIPTPSVSVTPDAMTGEVASETSTESATDSALPAPAVELLADGGFIVDLNRATEEDLRRLPGIGATRAKRILELRSRLGRFKTVDDLARIKGFGKTMLKRLRPLARAGA